MTRSIGFVVAFVLMVVASTNAASATVAAPGATVPSLYKNCTNFNKKYPHGVGRLRARDNRHAPAASPLK